MDPRIAPLFELAEDIALLRGRLASSAGSELAGCLKLDLARMHWTLDGLIDDLEDEDVEMPWWSDWRRRHAA